VSVVEEAIADRVGQGLVSEVVVPLGRRELARDDRRVDAIAILQDLEQVAALVVLDRGEAPVIDLCGAPHKSIHVEPSVMWSRGV
jgi:hypothetical protein